MLRLLLLEISIITGTVIGIMFYVNRKNVTWRSYKECTIIAIAICVSTILVCKTITKDVLIILVTIVIIVMVLILWLTHGFIIQERQFNNDKTLFCKNENNALFGLGMYYQSIGDIETMTKMYKLAIDGNNIPAMHKLAEYYIANKDNVNAIETYKLAIKLNDVTSMGLLAYLYYGIYDNDNAVTYYLMAINASNNDITKEKYIDAINTIVGSLYNNHKLAYRCKKYLNAQNLAKLNKYLNENTWMTEVKQEKITCCVCFTEQHKAFVSCFCKSVEYCHACVLKVVRCPVCREDIA